MSYPAIGEYGVIGDLDTCVLVSTSGSVDWCCFPHMASSSVFAALLDHEEGGEFRVSPSSEFESNQAYLTDTNILETSFRTDDGHAVVQDFMPTDRDIENEQVPSSVFRKVVCTEGSVEFDVNFAPAFDYARLPTRVQQGNHGLIARGEGEQLFLWSTVDLETEGQMGAKGSFSLSAGETEWLVLRYNTRQPLDRARCETVVEETKAYWQEWVERGVRDDPTIVDGYHEMVVRSALVLRLLTNRINHSIVAAPTTSLPEEIGGVRNWDYRFSWIRDSAFAIRALNRLGHHAEARDAFDWCLNQAQTGTSGEMEHPVYAPLPNQPLTEETLDHLEGYRESSPVRIGNEATQQLQLDIYGELVFAIRLASEEGEVIDTATWETLRDMITHVCSVWEEPDRGIWEGRDGAKQHVHSKVMCWAAIDSGLTIAEKQTFEAPVEYWKSIRSNIKETVLEEGYDDERSTFTQTFENEELDAVCLRIPLVGFLPADDERVQGTIESIMDELGAGDPTETGLLHRYTAADGLSGGENPFVICSFWLVESLALSGRLDEATAVFETVVGYRSQHDLFAEEMDEETGEHRGNYPQAFSHIGLINALHTLKTAREQHAS